MRTVEKVHVYYIRTVEKVHVYYIRTVEKVHVTTTESLHAERVSPAHPSAQGEWKPDWVNNYGRTYGKVEIQNKNYAN